METKQKHVLARVKVHLLLGKSITPKECVNMFDGWRLAHTIYMLKKEPHCLNIKTERVKTITGSVYAKYTLVKPTFNKNRYKDAITQHITR